jgi:hypothetical protein
LRRIGPDNQRRERGADTGANQPALAISTEALGEDHRGRAASVASSAATSTPAAALLKRPCPGRGELYWSARR